MGPADDEIVDGAADGELADVAATEEDGLDDVAVGGEDVKARVERKESTVGKF